jgi:hypothetical protein
MSDPVGASGAIRGLDSEDGKTFRLVKVDASGNLLVKTDVDFTADIEIDGTSVSQIGYQKADSGDNTCITPSSGFRLKIYRVVIYPSADITGEVQIKLGSTILSRPHSPKQGAMYGFNNHPNFALGGVDEALVVNLPSATTTNIDVCWEEV